MINEAIQSYINNIEIRCKEIKPLVVIRCITYNQDMYIKDTLDAFLMQKTDFPFIVIIHDDASTDKNPEIIKEYTAKYPNIFFPIFETENQYSQKNGSIGKIMNAATKATGAKYIALCEGDDYWIDPLKLQKQVDFLESYDDYSMVCTNSLYLYPNGEKKKSKHFSVRSRDISIEETILKGGLFIATASIMYRSKFLYKPYENKGLTIGDHPLQIYMAYKGKVRILEDICTIYRVSAQNSWSLKNKLHKNSEEYRKKLLNEKIQLANVMNEITENKYKDLFCEWIIIREFSYLIHFNPIPILKILKKNPLLIIKNFNIITILYGVMPIFIKKLILKNS